MFSKELKKTPTHDYVEVLLMVVKADQACQRVFYSKFDVNKVDNFSCWVHIRYKPLDDRMAAIQQF